VDFVWQHYYHARPLMPSGEESRREAIMLPSTARDTPEATENAWRTFRKMATDLRNPHMWYPLARSLPGGRRIVLHVGPTNRRAILRSSYVLTIVADAS
jgi:hypothetical protein